jgi:hypothetical protein
MKRVTKSRLQQALCHVKALQKKTLTLLRRTGFQISPSTARGRLLVAAGLHQCDEVVF